MKKLPSSFRDPNGFLFTREGTLFRQINIQYRDHYNKLIDSRLYDRLVSDHLLIPHTETDLPAFDQQDLYRLIQPEPLSFISYPYEWCFSQLKDAALTTLSIQKIALEYGMSLKDANAYNIQFHKGRAVLIDTLSFEISEEGQPWIAYRQFCQHFLAPLALMAYCDIRLNQLLRVYIDGIPLDLTSKLLPLKARLSFYLLIHIYLHAAAQKRYADKAINIDTNSRRVSKTSLLGLIDSLQSCIRGLKPKSVQTEWVDYYQNTNYSDSAREQKIQIIQNYLDLSQPGSVWDLGANTGDFSRLASNRDIPTIAFDIDPGAVEANYQFCKNNGEVNILPLIIDLTNPSPNLGWHHQERQSLLNRAPADAIMALALIHHLAISNNVPLEMAASFFSEAGKWLIIEFVPKSDSQVQKLLATRKDIFPNYTATDFETVFQKFFTIVERKEIDKTQRTIYLMRRL